MKRPASHFIRLTSDEYQHCKEVGDQLTVNNRVDNSNDYAPVVHKRSQYGFLGCLGEVAFCKYLGIEPNWQRMKSSAGRGDIDVAELWEIRATTPNACGYNGSPLTIWKHNLLKSKTFYSPFVKVCVRFKQDDSPPTCEIFGWEMGYIICMEEKLKPRKIGIGEPVIEREDHLLNGFVNPDLDVEVAARLRKTYLQVLKNHNENIF